MLRPYRIVKMFHSNCAIKRGNITYKNSSSSIKMDQGYTLKLDNPSQKANFLSKMFFIWMTKLYYKGTKRGLKIADLFRTLPGDKSGKLGDKVGKYWEQELKKNDSRSNKKPSLIIPILKAFGLNYLLWGFVLFFHIVILRSFQPLALSYFIKLFLDVPKENLMLQMYLGAALLVLLNFITVTLVHNELFYFGVVGMRVRVALSSLIYRKITRLSQASLNKTSAGYVVNLLSNDVNRFDIIPFALHIIWIMPFQIIILAYLIWDEVGISSLAGILSMVILTIPLQGFFGKLAKSLRMKVALRTDKRVSFMNEIISGIQVIKMYAWEESFEKIVKETRSSEISFVTKTAYLLGILFSSIVILERLTLYLTLVTYFELGHEISADKVFALAQFFNILQLSLAYLYPQAMLFGGEALVSIKRIREFLMLEEKGESKVEIVENIGIELNNVDASWNITTPILQNITVNVPKGSLCTILGPVGCGKTSLLELLLGEIPIVSGRVALGGTISYSSQKPWLFSSSVRNNIVFTESFDLFRYKTVIKTCALAEDFSQFPLGDRTLIGEKGVSLSGGQRARINLARAVYREADIYLLDDPLSAVDSSVGRRLFELCINGFLNGKTRILVTHQLHYLKQSDLILVLNQQGQIQAKGTFDDLMGSHMNLDGLLKEYEEKSPVLERTVSFEDEPIEISIRKLSIVSVDINTLAENFELQSPGQNNEESTMSDPKVSAFVQYLKSIGNICLVLTCLILLIISQTVVSGCDFFVAYWTEQEQLRNLNTSTVISQTTFYEETDLNNGNIQFLLKTDVALFIYSALISGTIIFLITRSLLIFKLAMRSSKNLHSKMFHSLLRAPLKFFEMNPTGRILNRFSKDMGAIDEILPRVLLNTIQIFCVILGILVNVGVANPYSVLAILIGGAVFWKLRQMYILTAKGVKYLEGVTKSPVFTHLSNSLNGITTIRASDTEEILIEEFDYHQDVHTSAWYLTLASTASFGLWLDILCTIFIGFVAFSFIILYDLATVNGSLVGLAISQALILTGVLQSGVRESAEVVNQLTAVERVLEYAGVEPEEKPSTAKEHAPDSWPTEGAIGFRNLFLTYNENDSPVLTNLTFDILPGQKIGIVGRTGAGKSSIISAIFRLAPIEGTIIIDEVDISKLELKQLRKKISIIPQEPVLFSNTLRYNLDPFNEYQDEQLWEALQEVQLKEMVPSLNYLISEGGANFSTGQRQLVCLARAIVRQNKILIMDEATANVDQKTDSLIQATIRKKFANCTVLTIAHRLNTIMDYDKILVINMGCMEEYGHPHELLQNPEGFLTRLVEETGTDSIQQLKYIASRNFYKDVNN